MMKVEHRGIVCHNCAIAICNDDFTAFADEKLAAIVRDNIAYEKNYFDDYTVDVTPLDLSPAISAMGFCKCELCEGVIFEHIFETMGWRK